jgi:hypothetical protein
MPLYAFLIVFRLGRQTLTWTRFAPNHDAAEASALRALHAEYGTLAELVTVVETDDPRT